jgi:hypothetical protein
VVQQSWKPKRWGTTYSPLNWSAAERAAITGFDTQAPWRVRFSNNWRHPLEIKVYPEMTMLYTLGLKAVG